MVQAFIGQLLGSLPNVASSIDNYMPSRKINRCILTTVDFIFVMLYVFLHQVYYEWINFSHNMLMIFSRNQMRAIDLHISSLWVCGQLSGSLG